MKPIDSGVVIVREPLPYTSSTQRLLFLAHKAVDQTARLILFLLLYRAELPIVYVTLR